MATKATASTEDSASKDNAARVSAAADATPPARPLPENYEAARDELATVVDTLEAGGLSLDESLDLWERGQALAKACETFLAGARRRVEEALAEESDAAGSE